MRSVRFLGVLPWLRERFTRFAGDRLLARKLDWDAAGDPCGGAWLSWPPQRSGCFWRWGS
jgi:hypothetical protein